MGSFSEDPRILVYLWSDGRFLCAPERNCNEFEAQLRQIGPEQNSTAHRGGETEGATVDNDLVYLDRRASEERTAARNCVHAGAREVHLELAQAYEFRSFLLKQVQEIESAPLQFDITENQTHAERARWESAITRVVEMTSPISKTR